MTFTESNTVEQMILDAASGLAGAPRHTAQQNLPLYRKDSGAEGASPARWAYVPCDQVPRQPGDVMVETWVREALIGLNPEIGARPDRADEVIYNLRAILCVPSCSTWSATTSRRWSPTGSRRRWWYSTASAASSTSRSWTS